ELAGVAQHGRRDRTAHVDVEALPFALTVGRGKTGESGGDAAMQLAPRTYCFERIGVRGAQSGGGQHAHKESLQLEHLRLLGEWFFKWYCRKPRCGTHSPAPRQP